MRLKEATEWIKNNAMDNKKIDYEICIKKLAKYEDLGEEGYLITLPIRPDDMCYVPTIHGVVQLEVDYIEYYGDEYSFSAIIIDGKRDWLRRIPYIGLPTNGDVKFIDLAINETVFLDKEKAECRKRFLVEQRIELFKKVKKKEIRNGRN